MEYPSVVTIDYREVRSIVGGSSPDSAVVEVLDRLFSAGLIASPLVLGPAAVPLLALFDMKSDLIKRVQELARWLAGRKTDFLERSRSLAAGHFLITYTAFYSAWQQELGPTLAEIAPGFDNAAEGSKAAVAAIPSPRSDMDGDVGVYAGIAPVSLPHPAADFGTEDSARLAMYTNMAKILTSALALDFFDDLDQATRQHLHERLKAIPGLAQEFYYAQFLDLMLEFGDFFTYASVYSHAKTQSLIVDGRHELDEKLTGVVRALTGIDLGLAEMTRALDRLKATAPAAQSGSATEVAATLAARYSRRVDQPIIRDEYEEPPGQAALAYPSKRNAFVPQAYRAIRHGGGAAALEDETVWASADRHDDLVGFIVRFLSSPHSTQAPLLILGHPGSGKSMLTEVIAAQLAAPTFNVLRVELRDIEPGRRLQETLENQIEDDTGHRIGWVDFSRGLNDNPPLIILDGYDELLQSSGRVFSNYLEDVHKFQLREADSGRPVRVIITSRITLIDKTAIPKGTSIMRLEEFDKPRCDLWIDHWNSVNAGYFQASEVDVFQLPARRQIVEMAKQPLLLLMLALYDSERNQLRAAGVDIDQTQLYYNLLSRFVRREREKGTAGASFRMLAEAEQLKVIDDDLERLGVAAIGMFNRNTVHIHRRDLNADIAYFQTGQSATGHSAELSQADLLLGSFFFIHESRSRSGHLDSSGTPTRGEQAAFEFLHNTFGEFLAADFILRRIMVETQKIASFGGNPAFAEELQSRLANPRPHWFAALSYTALHTRPVILDMLRSWLPRRLAQSDGALGAFADCLRQIVDRQLHDVLNTAPPAWLTARTDRPALPEPPLLGMTATYTLNLVLVAAALCPDGYEFADPSGDENLCRPWDRLTNLWRSWFSLQGMAGISAILTCERTETCVRLRAKETFGLPASRSPIETALNVADALGDELGFGIAALGLAHAFPVEPEQMARALNYWSRDLTDPAVAVLHSLLAKDGRLPASDYIDSFGRMVLHANRAPEHGQIPRAARAAIEILSSMQLPHGEVDRVPIMHPERMEAITVLSRYDAELVIRFNSAIHPPWLWDLWLVTLASPGRLASPYVPPMLRTLREGYIHFYPYFAREAAEAQGFRGLALPPDLDPETYVELALSELSPWAAEDLDSLLASSLESLSTLCRIPFAALLRLLNALAVTDDFPQAKGRLVQLGVQNDEAGALVSELCRLTLTADGWDSLRLSAGALSRWGFLVPDLIELLVRSAHRWDKPHELREILTEMLEPRVDFLTWVEETLRPRTHLFRAFSPGSMSDDLDWLTRELRRVAGNP